MVKNNSLAVNNQIILVTGASRSGKSEWAEKLATKSDLQVVYVATALNSQDDPEWEARIKKHQQRRPSTWQIIEESKNLAAIIAQGHPDQCFLVDSLGTWVANLLDLETPEWKIICQELVTNLLKAQAQFIFVAEETGWGLVPAYESGRIFRDRLGQLTRTIGNIASTTYLVAAGHALNLSLLGTPLDL